MNINMNQINKRGIYKSIIVCYIKTSLARSRKENLSEEKNYEYAKEEEIYLHS
jgi:hypothetical protein